MTDGLQRYEPATVQALFDRMASTYGWVNLIASFGFCHRWRKQCVELAEIRGGERVYDLMSGMGECWPFIARRQPSEVVGVDFSRVMCERAERTRARLPDTSIRILEADALASGLPDGEADVVLSSFGLKTFSVDQRVRLATEVARMLRPGGRFSLVEISVPRSCLLRPPYMFYLHRCIPLIGAAFLGRPDTYRMLGRYTDAFGDCAQTADALRAAGLVVEERDLFFSCATALVGHKPTAS